MNLGVSFNVDWIHVRPILYGSLFFLEANVTHLARVNSDHCPLLLNLSPNIVNASNRPFRFQPMWLNHNDFLAIVKEEVQFMLKD